MNEEAEEGIAPRAEEGAISGNKSRIPLLSSARLGELSSKASSFQMELVENNDPERALLAEDEVGMGLFKSSSDPRGMSIAAPVTEDEPGGWSIPVDL